jgi:hypothetical protein
MMFHLPLTRSATVEEAEEEGEGVPNEEVAALDLTECGGLLQEIKIAEVSFLK